jgi:hypothetical protein
MRNCASEWSWSVDADCGLSIVKMAGVITANDIVAAQHHLAAHASFNPSFALIVDLTLAAELPLTAGDMRTVITSSPVALHAPRAIVAKTIVSAAMAHAYCAMRRRVTGTDVAHVCASLREAHQWIGTRRDRSVYASR